MPLIRESIRHIREKRFTLEGFLAAGCVVAAASGQAATALEILWIQSGAESLNAWVSERSRRSVSAILDLTAKNTFILVGDVEVEIPVSGVKPRDIVVLHTGEKISVDGEVVSGDALVDDSPMTYTFTLDHNRRAQISEGLAAHLLGGEGENVTQFASAGTGERFVVTRILPGEEAEKFVASLGVRPGSVLVLITVAT